MSGKFVLFKIGLKRFASKFRKLKFGYYKLPKELKGASEEQIRNFVKNLPNQEIKKILANYDTLRKSREGYLLGQSAGVQRVLRDETGKWD